MNDKIHNYKEKKDKKKTIMRIVLIIDIILIILLFIKCCTNKNAHEAITFSGSNKECYQINYGQVFDPKTIKVYENGKEAKYKASIDVSKINYTKLGTYSINVRYTTKEGKLYEAKRCIQIIDNEAPVILLKGSDTLTLPLNGTYDELGYEVFDNYDKEDDIKVTISGKVDTSKTGTYTLTYTATDKSGNKSKVTRKVMVVKEEKNTVIKQGKTNNNTSPVAGIIGVTTLQLKGTSTMYLEYLDDYTEPGFVAIDTKDGDITDKVSVSGVVNSGQLGQYKIVYYVTNSGGRTTTITRTVIVRDTSPVTIQINGENPILVEAGSEYIDLGASAVNRVGTVPVTVYNPVDINVLGIYHVIYTAIDGLGNEVQAYRTVLVFDDSEPAILFFSSIEIIGKGEEIEDPCTMFLTGVSGWDDFDGDITEHIWFIAEKISNDIVDTFEWSKEVHEECNAWFDSDIEGEYKVTYYLEDSSGNQAEPRIRWWYVVDLEDPIGTVSYSTTDPTNQDVTVTIATDKDIETPEGWTMVNDTTFTKIFEVNDDEEVWLCHLTIDFMMSCGVAIVSVTNIDKEPITSSVTYSETNMTNHDVTATLQTNKAINTPSGWTKIDGTIFQKSYSTNTTESVSLSDVAGNTASASVAIANIDKIGPVITIIGPNPVTSYTKIPYFDVGATAIDDVDGTVGVSVSMDVDINAPGTYYVTYTAIDQAGNVSTVNRTVILKNDNTLKDSNGLTMPRPFLGTVPNLGGFPGGYGFTTLTLTNQKTIPGGSITSTYDVGKVPGNVTMWIDDAGNATIGADGLMIAPTNSGYLFSELGNTTRIDGLEYLDTSNVTTMARMFNGSSFLTSLDVTSFNTSKVTDMSAMFYACQRLTSLDVSNFDTSKVTNMAMMFYQVRTITSLDVSNFNTSKVTSMSSMFMGMTGLRGTLDLSSFDTSKVTNMTNMFYQLINIDVIDIRNATFSSVTSYDRMFYLVPDGTTVIVKDETARSWIQDKFPTGNIILPSEL